MPDTNGSAHALTAVESRTMQHAWYSDCRCGWTSQPQTSKTMASVAHGWHVREVAAAALPTERIA